MRLCRDVRMQASHVRCRQCAAQAPLTRKLRVPQRRQWRQHLGPMLPAGKHHAHPLALPQPASQHVAVTPAQSPVANLLPCDSHVTPNQLRMIILPMPYPTWPVATRLRPGCIAMQRMSSSCPSKKIWLWVSGSYTTPTAACMPGQGSLSYGWHIPAPPPPL